MYLIVAYPKYFDLPYELESEDLVEKIYRIPKGEHGWEVPEGGYILKINDEVVYEHL